MSDPKGILQDEEVDFLLSGDGSRSDKGPPLDGARPEALASHEVTMKGDLEKLDLSDIFQTLAMSKMEGVLRVRNPLEQRELMFRDGTVRAHIPGRIETKRLGQRLILAGMISPDELRSALLEQKRGERRIGELLIETGRITEEQLAEILASQAAEDLFAVFTWTGGSFEFYRGECTDPVLAGLFENAVPFDVQSMLMEVARRQDEWQVILDRLHSVDEIPVLREDLELPGDLANDLRAVAEVMDGAQSIRQIGDTSLIGLFSAARAVRELYDLEYVDLAAEDQMLAAARHQLEHGEVKRAALTLRTLLERPVELSPDIVEETCELLSRVGDRKLAARTMLAQSRAAAQRSDAIDLARRARRLDNRSVEILEHLRDLLLAGEPEPAAEAELREVVVDLAEALMHVGRHDEALSMVVRIEEVDPGDTANLSRKARLLHRLGRPQEAVEVLLGLAEQFRNDKRNDKLAAVYEQILKIDHRRRDVARALKSLHAGRLGKVRNAAIAAAVVGLVAVAGVLWYENRQTEELLAGLVDEVNAALASGDTAAASAALGRVSTDHADSDQVAGLRDRVQRTVQRQREAEERQAAEERRAALGEATELLDKGDIDAAVSRFETLLAGVSASRAAEIETTIRGRLLLLLDRLQALRRDLPAHMPAAPEPLQTEAVRKRVLADIDEHFRADDHEVARGIATLGDNHAVLEPLTPQQRAMILESAREVVQHFDDALERRELHLEYQRRVEHSRQLGPLFERAREHELAYRFREALEVYRQLASEHPADDQVQDMLRDQIERHATITRFLEVLETATAEGDFARARGQLRALQRNFPDVPFDRLVRLPVRIETTPAGATVRLAGEVIGETPLTTSFVPGDETPLELSLPGFETETAGIGGDEVGAIRSTLTLSADYDLSTDAVVDRAPALDGHGNAYVADRSGRVTSFAIATGEARWVFESGDLSGLLGRPAVRDGRVFISSADGRLRCLSAADGTVIWQREGLGATSGPIATGNSLALATTRGELHGFEPATGEQRYRVPLPGGVEADLELAGEQIHAVTLEGAVVALRITDGRLLWRTDIDGSLAVPAHHHDGRVLVVDDTTHVLCLDARDGRVLWKHGGLSGAARRPAAYAGRVFVAAGNALHTYDLADGKPGAVLRNVSTWSSHVAASSGHVFAGSADGLVYVIDPETLETRFLLRGQGSPQARVIVDEQGRTLATFADRVLRGYTRLP